MFVQRGNKLFLNTENHIADNFAAIYSKPGHILLTDHSTNTYDLIPFNFDDKVILLTDAKVPRIDLWNKDSVSQPENVLLLGELKERKTNVYGGWKYEENPNEVNEVLSVVNEEMRIRLDK